MSRPILKSFKTDHSLGAEHLASICSQLSKAEGFAIDHKAIIDEAKQWGYNHNDIATTKSIIGMDYLKEIRNVQLFKCVIHIRYYNNSVRLNCFFQQFSAMCLIHGHYYSIYDLLGVL